MTAADGKPAVVGQPSQSGPSIPAIVLRVGSHPTVYSVLVALAISSVLFFLSIAPSVRALQPGGTASLADARSAYDAAAAKLAADKAIIDKAASLPAETRQRLAYALPADADAPGLSVQLYAIGRATGVRVTGLDIATSSSAETAAGETPNNIKQLDISLSVDHAPYVQMKLLLDAFESSLRLMDVRNMNFSPASGTATLQIRTYYLANK